MDAEDRKALAQITIVAVNYNSGEVIGSALAPLAEFMPIVVVDNASVDGSGKRIAADFPQARQIRNDRNAGYGRAINQGMALVETPFALHLNPDAILTPQAVLRLGRAATEAKAAIAAPFLFKPDGRLDLSVKGPGERGQTALKPVPAGDFCTWFVTGAVWLVDTRFWRHLGGFDENIFLYNEDYDLCRRVIAAGGTILVSPEAEGQHMVSRSTKPTTRIRWRKEWNIVWSHLYLERKFDGPAAAQAEAWRLVRKHGPKALFYLLAVRPKRLLRDLAVAHAALSFLAGRGPFGSAPHS